MKKVPNKCGLSQIDATQNNAGLKWFHASAISASMTLLLSQTVATSYASDIEIYSSAGSAEGAAVVVMMLDTSGSMDLNAAGTSACDLQDGESFTSKGTDTATGGYARSYCNVSGARSYLYRERQVCSSYSWWGNCTRTQSTWYNCPSGTTTASGCTATRSNAPSTSGLSNTGASGGFPRDIYYYRTETVKRYDRISRLKDALYSLAIAPADDPTTEAVEGLKTSVKIGIGTYPHYGSGYDINRRGKIRLPAATWGEPGSPQRTAVINLIKSSNFKGQGGTPTSAGYAEAAAYLLGTTTGGGSFSGMDLAPSGTFTGSGASKKYISPMAKTAYEAKCDGRGIFFLTDGEPQTPGATPTSDLMKNALNLSSYNFSTGLTGGGNVGQDLGDYGGIAKSDWQAIGSFAKSLNDSNIIKNFFAGGQAYGSDLPVVKTAVVGFGSAFTGTPTDDSRNAEAWGGDNYGRGGFVATNESGPIIDLLNGLIRGFDNNIPSVSTGSSTIPRDALNPESLQADSYFPQFEPKVEVNATQQVWFGNLKKYFVRNNSVYASETNDSSQVVSSQGLVRDLPDRWARTPVNYSADAIYKKGGALSRLILGTEINNDGVVTGRKLLTDYAYDNSQSVIEGRDLGLVRITNSYTTDDTTKTDTRFARPLMAALGYQIAANENTNGLDLVNRTPTNYQIGTIMHSLPVLVTQSGTLVAIQDDDGGVSIGSDDREDYVLFGTSQGMLHVVNAETGAEKFSFLPKEMLEKQSQTLLPSGGSLVNGKNALYYGMDGEWTAHSVYVSDDNGKLSVGNTSRRSIDDGEDDENLEGKQWVYGGMRMGGRSYYALDLTDIDHPKIKFHIDPSTGKIYRPAVDDEGNHFIVEDETSEIENMGQSWSKPRLDYVNWKGERKLVMFVGGGYDAGGDDGDGLFDENGVRTGYDGYEHFNYQQDNEVGAGVYMFDADNGELLWHADDSDNEDLKYSVVSEIKTVDRNNDGMVDHLYFGDLAGQAFRVDFKNDGGSTFTNQVIKVLDLHEEDGTSPRFYLPPTFTAHYSAGQEEGGNIIVAAFVSGNKSSPLLASANSPTDTGQRSSTGLEYDAVYAIYDYDIFPNGVNFPSSNLAARTRAVSNTANNTQLKEIDTIVTQEGNPGAFISQSTGWGGWYYPFKKNYAATDENKGIVKGLSPLIALGGDLYVTMFDASDLGTSSDSCGAGVKGASFAKRICLPTGKCAEDADYTYNLGAGIVTLGVGGGDSGGSGRTLVVPNPNEVCEGDNCSPCVGDDCGSGGVFKNYGGNMRFIPNRWYERYATERS